MTSPRGLEEALAEAARALDAGDAPAAALAMGEAARFCEVAQREGLRLDAASLARAHALWERCGHASEKALRRMEASLLQLGTSRRAFGAYRRP